MDSIVVDNQSGPSSDMNASVPIPLLTIPAGIGAGIHTIDFSDVDLDISFPSTTKIGNYSGSMSLQLVGGP